MIERFLTHFDGLDVGNLEYLLARIGHTAPLASVGDAPKPEPAAAE